MSDLWYDEIALRNGGYLTTDNYKTSGISAENIFHDLLIKQLKSIYFVLDAGCGHGNFTYSISKLVSKIVGIDFSKEMIKIACNNCKNDNLEFMVASTKNKLPFNENTFDFIFSRRGPISIIDHKRILKNDGIIMGIHSAGKSKIEERLITNEYREIKIVEYYGVYKIFDKIEEYRKYLADFPGNKNYLLNEHENEFNSIVESKMQNGIIKEEEIRYIWSAKK